MKQYQKIVLAYSGGLDTSVIIPWLKEHYKDCEVIAVAADVGQGAELSGLEERRWKTGRLQAIYSGYERRICGRLHHPYHAGRRRL